MRARRRMAMAGVCLAAIALLASCGFQDVFGDDVVGSGNLTTETRDASGFTEIMLASSGDVIVTVGGTDSITIEAEDNIMPLLTTDVVDGRLELFSSESFDTDIGVTYTITVARLTGIELNGAGDFDVTGVDADRFEIVLSGAGSATVSGQAGELLASLSGAGDIDASDLSAQVGDVRIDGAGNVTVNVAVELAAFIDGAGDIVYLGDPEVTQTINGAGEVRQR